MQRDFQLFPMTGSGTWLPFAGALRLSFGGGERLD